MRPTLRRKARRAARVKSRRPLSLRPKAGCFLYGRTLKRSRQPLSCPFRMTAAQGTIKSPRVAHSIQDDDTRSSLDIGFNSSYPCSEVIVAPKKGTEYKQLIKGTRMKKNEKDEHKNGYQLTTAPNHFFYKVNFSALLFPFGSLGKTPPVLSWREVNVFGLVVA